MMLQMLHVHRVVDVTRKSHKPWELFLFCYMLHVLFYINIIIIL